MSSINQNGAQQKMPIALKLWTFNLVADTFGVTVDGYREHDDTGQTLGNWSTTTIKRVTGHGKTIETVSGSVYKLVGDADKIQLKKNGFPDTLIQLFIHGFPQNWENLLKEYWEKRKSTNPLNANNWFDHKMAVEIKRKSLGVKLHDKTRQSRIGTAQEARSKSFAPDMPLPATPPSLKEPVRRSPRTHASDLSTVPATPSTAANITSNTMQAKKKEDNEPTPRFVPQTDGRSLRRRSSSVVSSTPIKGRKTDVAVPDVQEIKSTPRRRSQSVIKQNVPTPQTPTTRANNSSGRITRSASVQREAPAVGVRSTPRRSASKAPVETPTNKRSRSVAPSPAKTTPTLKRGRKSTNNNDQEIAVEAVEQATVNNSTENGNDDGNQEVSTDSFKAPLSTTRVTPRAASVRAPSVPNKPKATTLFQWHLKFMPEMAGKSGDLPPFILIGHQMIEAQPAEEAQLWHTTLIMRVAEGESPEDWSFHTSRSEYKLSGKIAIREMVPLGFTQDFVRAFLTGFPRNYRELLWTAFNNLKQGSDEITAKPNNSTRPQRQEPLPELEDMDVDEGNSTMSSRGRNLRKTSPPPIAMPRLNVEKDRRQRVQPKKRTMEYSSSSSSDNEAIIRTLRDVHYDDDIFRKPNKKKRRTTDNDSENYVASDLLRKMAQKKRKLQKQMDVLDEKMREIIIQMEEKLARQDRINAIKARDREERVNFKGNSKKQRKMENFPRRTQAIVYTSSSDSDMTSASSDEDSTETEVTDDGGEWERTPKYKNQRARTMKKKPINKRKRSAPQEDEDPNLFDDINNEYSDLDITKKPKKIKKKAWRQIDLDRLKHAINVIKVNSEEDWEQISKTVGPEFSAEDCKDVAIKKLHWKPPQIKEKRPDAEEQLVIKAREGTQAYGIQLNEKHRQYMLGAGSQGGDCFREQAPEDDDEMAMTNVADLDESILAALRTPTIAEMPPKRRAGPLIAAAVEEEDTPQATRKSLAAFEEQQNTAQRESHQRYLHQITNNRSFFNMSRHNNTANVSKIGTSRAAENIGKKMDRIKKGVHAHRKRNDSDFDEEEEGLID